LPSTEIEMGPKFKNLLRATFALPFLVVLLSACTIVYDERGSHPRSHYWNSDRYWR
jgi:hypothetical protein